MTQIKWPMIRCSDARWKSYKHHINQMLKMYPITQLKNNDSTKTDKLDFEFENMVIDVEQERIVIILKTKGLLPLKSEAVAEPIKKRKTK